MGEGEGEGKQGLPSNEFTCLCSSPLRGMEGWSLGKEGLRHFDVELTALDWLWDWRDGREAGTLGFPIQRVSTLTAK